MSVSEKTPERLAKDIVGRVIKAGVEIAYPVRRGSEMWLNRLQVQQVIDNGVEWTVSGYNSEGRRVNVHNLDNIIVLMPL
jgi:hypothetical protein